MTKFKTLIYSAVDRAIRNRRKTDRDFPLALEIVFFIVVVVISGWAWIDAYPRMKEAVASAVR